MYGPYTLEDLQRYLASGNVLPTDLAKSEEMSDWLPVSQILAGAQAGHSAESGFTTPSYAAPRSRDARVCLGWAGPADRRGRNLSVGSESPLGPRTAVQPAHLQLFHVRLEPGSSQPG